MDKIVLSDKFFHATKPNISFFGITDYDKTSYEIIIEKINKIFEGGFILCRQDMHNKYANYDLSRVNLNGDYCVSLSKHHSTLSADFSHPGHVINADEEDAWTDYPFNYPAFVFDKRLFIENCEEKHCVRIPLEIQVQKSIDIKKAVAISIPMDNSVAPFFEKDASCDKAIIDYKRNKYKYLQLKRILEIVKEHSNLPVVSIDTGSIYKDNIDYENKVKCLSNNGCLIK